MIKKIIKCIPYSIYLAKAFKRYIEYFQVQLIQKRYNKVINKKKKKISMGEKVRVAFFVTQKQLWSAQSLYDEFSGNEYFEPLIVVFPDNENTVNSKAETLGYNYDFFIQKGMSVICGYNAQDECYSTLKSINADIIFYDQPSPNINESLLWRHASKNSLVCYIPYGYKVAGFYQAHFNMSLQNSCWIVFSESNWHTEQFIKYGVLKGKNVVTSGYPKLDVYNNDSINDIKKIHSNKMIMWAPHWSIGEQSIGYSTFDKNYMFFLEYARNNSNVDWIFKPHQRLRAYLVESGFMKKSEVDDYYSQWEALPNTRFYNDSDYFDLFKRSDALITDCGSFLAEYLPTKKPILHLASKHCQGYNEVGDKLIGSYYKATNIDEIKHFIDDVVINERDVLMEQRLSNLHLVQPNSHGAGKFIVDCIQARLIGDD